jgi:hypothetical protein
VVVAALAGGGYLYYRLDDEIRQQVERTFAQHYQHLEVQVTKARYENGQGITVYGLSIREPRAGGPAQPILAIDELFLACNMTMEQMLSGKPHLQRIVVRRPRLRAIRLADGQWNVRALVPLPKLSDQSPELEIDDATLILEDATRHDVAPLALRGVDLRLTPIASASSTAPHVPSFQVAGNATGAPARKFTFSGTAGCTDGTLDLTIEVGGLEISPELLAAVPGPRPAEWADVQLFGSADATIRLVRAEPNGAIQWRATAAVNRGRIDHPLLPLPLTELAMKIEADPRRLFVEELRGKFGAADVVLACERHGWAANAPLGLAGRLTSLAIDSQLAARLPERGRQIWQRFQPTGMADAEVALTFDGHRWRPEFTANCRAITLTDAEKFPYTLSQVNGTLKVTGSPHNENDLLLRLDLEGHGNGQPIRIAAELDRIAQPRALANTLPQRLPTTAADALPPKPVGWIEVSGNGILLHEHLLTALPDNAEPFVRALRPEGALDFRWRYERDDPYALQAETSLNLKFIDCAIQYDAFPYPLERVQGTVTARNGIWTLNELESRDRQGQAVITCNGESQISPAGQQLRLVIQGENVLLDEHLKQSLPPAVQEIWSQLRPQGRVNFVANVGKQPGQPKPEVFVDLRPYEKSVSIEPTFFPYRLEELGGRALVSPGRVEIQNGQAKHGQSTFAAQGSWLAMPEGGWQLDLSSLNADRLSFDSDLFRALPPGVQRVVDRMRPTGNFDLYQSSLSFTRRPDAPQIASSWDIQLACHQAALRGEMPLENLSGGVRIIGSSDGPNAQSHGELAIDSLIWNDMQLTNIRGPFWTDSAYCLMGRHATERLRQPPRRITADVYGGKIETDVQLQHTGQTRYAAETSIEAVDLGRLARERLGGPADMTGTVSGTLSLAGVGRTTSALTGRGDLKVVDANIYQLPPLVALLKVLRNRSPDSTAFNRCEAQFDVRGEHIHFHQLNLLGDAASLYGRGETNFNRRLNLVFYTLVGPADLPIPLWKTVAGQLSQQGLQLKVDGTWDDPQIHREAFPAVGKMLQQIRDEAQQTAVMPAPEAARNWWTPPLR